MRPRLLLACLIVASIARASSGPEPVDLLLVAADDATLQPILQRLDSPRVKTTAAWTLWLGRLSNKSVAVTRTEGDPLNAVAATTLALRQHPPRLVIVFGTSRAHDPALRSGDIVVSDAFCAFDGMISPVAPLDAGSDALTWRKLLHPVMTAGEDETPMETFPADASAAALALSLASPPQRIVSGILGSAPQINREADRIAFLHSEWKTSTEDGESAHVAGCAFLFRIPVIGLRVIDAAPASAAEFTLRFVDAWK
jgi:Nucleoside phosphorylase